MSNLHKKERKNKETKVPSKANKNKCIKKMQTIRSMIKILKLKLKQYDIE